MEMDRTRTNGNALGAPPHAEDSDLEDVALVWIDRERAVVVRWDEEPIVEHLDSGVPSRRRAVGSVRRGPARPYGGGRVPGHGTKTKHEQEMRQFLAELASRLLPFEAVEIAGRGTTPVRFADLLRDIADHHNTDLTISTRILSRRPSDRQLQARLRKLVGAELPRRLVGRYRLPTEEPTTPTGRPLRPAGGRRTLRPAPLPEWREIAEEVEALLGDTPWDDAEAEK